MAPYHSHSLHLCLLRSESLNHEGQNAPYKSTVALRRVVAELDEYDNMTQVVH